MKPLIPSHKENKRYLLVHGKELKENIEKAILELSGTRGISKCGLSFISSDSSKNSAVISVNRESVDLVRASLAVFPEKMEVLRVSGTLKGLKRKVK
jgi:RNase P/RNase MRP subunit POP5